MIKLFLDFGATTALLNQHGTLFSSSEYEGARVLIEGHRNEHTDTVMKVIMDKSKKSLVQLSQVFVVRKKCFCAAVG